MNVKEQEAHTPFLRAMRKPSLVAKVLVVSLLIATIFVFLDGLVGGFVMQLSAETLFLGSELKKEAGPHFAKSKEAHIRMSEELIGRMESRESTQLISKIWPKYAPRKNLEPALETLRKAGDSDVASREAIANAAERFLAVGENWAHARQPGILLQGSSISICKASLRDQYRRFEKSANDFEMASLVDSAKINLAEEACRQSRLVCFYALGACLGKTEKAEIRPIATHLNSLSESLNEFGQSLTGDSRDQVLHYARNVKDRATIVVGLSDGGPIGARRVILAQLQLDQ